MLMGIRGLILEYNARILRADLSLQSCWDQHLTSVVEHILVNDILRTIDLWEIWVKYLCGTPDCDPPPPPAI